MKKEIRLGGHLKTSEGLSLAIATARGLRYNEIQIMAGPEKGYKPWELDEETCREFQTVSYGIITTVHLPYIINPCEGAPQRRGFYKKSLKDFIRTSHALGARRMVLHPGFKKDLDEGEAKENLLRFLEEIWEVEFTARLLLETDSGSKNGSAIGSAEFIADCLSKTELENVGMCLDTTHIYARGIDIWDRSIRTEFLDQFGHLIELVHMNCPDKEVSLGSFRDRHNTPFEERQDLKHQGLIEDLSQFPMILERRSLRVQQKDNIYIRDVLGQPFGKQKA